MRLFKKNRNFLKEIFNTEEIPYYEYVKKYRGSWNCFNWNEVAREYARKTYGSIHIGCSTIQMGDRPSRELVLTSRPERNSERQSDEKVFYYYEAAAICENGNIYSVFWTKINPEAENEAEACDWETYYVADVHLDLYTDVLEKLALEDLN